MHTGGRGEECNRRSKKGACFGGSVGQTPLPFFEEASRDRAEGGSLRDPAGVSVGRHSAKKGFEQRENAEKKPTVLTEA